MKDIRVQIHDVSYVWTNLTQQKLDMQKQKAAVKSMAHEGLFIHSQRRNLNFSLTAKMSE